MAMAYTQDQLTALETALAKGEKRVSFGDKTVEYRSVDELQSAIDIIKRELFEQAAADNTGPSAPRRILITTRKGL